MSVNVDGSLPGDAALYNPLAESPLLDLTATHATVAPPAQEVIRRELATAAAILGAQVECLWACTWDPATRTITSARTLSRGALTMVQYNRDCLAPGEIALHNHPSGNLCPSESDLESIPGSKYGDGIVSCDGTRVYLMREPAPGAQARARHYFGGRLSIVTTATTLLVAWTRRPTPAAHP